MAVYATRFVIHDRSLRVEWSASLPRPAIETILQYHGAEQTEADASSTWTLRADPGCNVPEGARLVASHDSGLSLWQSDEAYFIAHSEGALCISLASGSITGQLPSSGGGTVSEGCYVATTLMLLLLLEHVGYYALHAACLVHPDGAGVLLIGPSDSGKSTMALHLVEQGWQYLSDDSVLLHAGPDGISVLPLRRDFCLDPEAEALFPSLAGTSARMLTDADKWRVRVEHLFPTQQRPSCRPSLLLFPRIEAERATSALQPLRPIESLMALLPQASLLRRDPKEARTFTQLTQRLVAQAPAYRFLSGADVYRDGARLARLLEPLFRSADAPTVET